MSFENKVGLVLSGGGMRGMAHIGVIQAMREFGIEADIVSGTSIGAVIGSLYASDMPTKDMLNFFRDITIFTFRNYAFKKPGLLDPEKFRSKLLDTFPSDSFEILTKDLFVSVTDLYTGKNRLVDSGSLSTALMCSAAIPGVFAPVKVGNSLYSDGGLTNSYPIEPLQNRCQFIVGSYVNPLIPLENESTFKNTLSLFDRALVISTYRMEFPSFHIADVFVMPEELHGIPTLSLKHIDKAYEIGYTSTVEKLTAYFENNENTFL